MWPIRLIYATDPQFDMQQRNNPQIKHKSILVSPWDSIGSPNRVYVDCSYYYPFPTSLDLGTSCIWIYLKHWCWNHVENDPTFHLKMHYQSTSVKDYTFSTPSRDQAWTRLQIGGHIPPVGVVWLSAASYTITVSRQTNFTGNNWYLTTWQGSSQFDFRNRESVFATSSTGDTKSLRHVGETMNMWELLRWGVKQLLEDLFPSLEYQFWNHSCDHSWAVTQAMKMTSDYWN